MVNNQQDPLDAVFHALADPTRRAMVARLWLWHRLAGPWPCTNRLNFDVGKSIPDNPELFLGENEEQKSQLLFLNVNDSDVGEDNDGTIELRDKDGKALGLKTSRTYIYMGENQ